MGLGGKPRRLSLEACGTEAAQRIREAHRRGGAEARQGKNVPDMSVTSTCTAWRRSVMAERRLSSVICAIAGGESQRARGGRRAGGRFAFEGCR